MTTTPDDGSVVGESPADERLGESAEDNWRLLAEAGMLLSSSLDVETTLASIARLAVPRLADWCVVYVLDDHGSIRRLALEHSGHLAADVQAVLDRHPLDPDAEGGVPRWFGQESPFSGRSRAWRRCSRTSPTPTASPPTSPSS